MTFPLPRGPVRVLPSVTDFYCKLISLLSPIDETRIKMHEKKYGTYVLLTLLTGLFGGNWYYLNEHGKGIVRTCTMNFVMLGWFRDIVMVRKDFNTTMASQGILSARTRS